MFWHQVTPGTPDVVPRKGDVDRNGTWEAYGSGRSTVVPRKGDVDRNLTTLLRFWGFPRRPPQGGRG